MLQAPSLLTFFVVLAAGAAIGQIRFGSLRFGAAGALFVGLAVSATYPQIAPDVAILQTLGLALFVYTVGVGAGATFMSQLRHQFPLIVAAAVTATAGAVTAIILGRVLSIPRELTTGLFTGALTSAPALESALRVTGSSQPGAGYAVGYPFGVVVGILVVSSVVMRHWPALKDTPSLAGVSLVARTASVDRTINVRDIPAWRDQQVRASYLRRGNRTRVVVPGEDLLPGDLVVFVGLTAEVEAAIAAVGNLSEEHLADDRRDVDFERITVSNPDIAGRTIAELNLPVRFGAVITRVRRGDLDLLARDDLALQPGDHVAVAVPGRHLRAVCDYFGNSERKVSQVDAVALGIGMVLGMGVGLISVPLPSGASFSLGAAAGPLVVGIVLGALRRTGVIVWSLPESANATIRQLGLLFFMTALGLGAGPAFITVATTSLGWKAAILATVVASVGAISLAVSGRFLQLSGPRVAGAVAGFLGQPAIMQAATSRCADERIESSYAALFAACIVVKIILIPLIYALA